MCLPAMVSILLSGLIWENEIFGFSSILATEGTGVSANDRSGRAVRIHSSWIQSLSELYGGRFASNKYFKFPPPLAFQSGAKAAWDFRSAYQDSTRPLHFNAIIRGELSLLPISRGENQKWRYWIEEDDRRCDAKRGIVGLCGKRRGLSEGGVQEAFISLLAPSELSEGMVYFWKYLPTNESDAMSRYWSCYSTKHQTLHGEWRKVLSFWKGCQFGMDDLTFAVAPVGDCVLCEFHQGSVTRRSTSGVPRPTHIQSGW